MTFPINEHGMLEIPRAVDYILRDKLGDNYCKQMDEWIVNFIAHVQNNAKTISPWTKSKAFAIPNSNLKVRFKAFIDSWYEPVPKIHFIVVSIDGQTGTEKLNLSKYVNASHDRFFEGVLLNGECRSDEEEDTQAEQES